MKKVTKPVDVYVKEKLETRKMDVNYNRGKAFGIEDTIFNFTSEPVKEPFGDVAFTTGYEKNPEYTSTFLMTAQEAMELGKMLIDTAYEAMSTKRIILEAEAYESKLSFLVLKGLIDTIRIERSTERLKNYESPYYKYIMSAYKDNEKVFSYATVYNLSYFTSENEIDYWKDKLTDKERVKIYFDKWDPYKELAERRIKSLDKALKNPLFDHKYNSIKPIPIQK